MTETALVQLLPWVGLAILLGVLPLAIRSVMKSVTGLPELQRRVAEQQISMERALRLVDEAREDAEKAKKAAESAKRQMHRKLGGMADAPLEEIAPPAPSGTDASGRALPSGIPQEFLQGHPPPDAGQIVHLP